MSPPQSTLRPFVTLTTSILHHNVNADTVRMGILSDNGTKTPDDQRNRDIQTVADAFVNAASSFFNSSATMVQGPGPWVRPDPWAYWHTRLDGLMAIQYEAHNSRRDSRPTNCTAAWTDPMDDMISQMRDLVFRTALDAGAYFNMNPDNEQTVSYNSTTPTTVYRTNFTYTWTAAVISLLGTLSVIPLFWGWWELGRPMTFGPLEIANAFEAPLFNDMGSNSKESQSMRKLSRRKVMYGGYVGMEGRRRLAIREQDSVEKAQKGDLFY